MSATNVRRASPEDAAAIAGIHVRSWQVAYRGLVPDAVLDGLSVQQREAVWRQLLSGGGEPTFTLVAERGCDVAGFCSVAAPSRDDDARDRTCEVAAVYVEPDAWRTGIGRALLNTALHEVRGDGWNEATLWVLAENDAARAFYDSFGFTLDGAAKRRERTGQPEVRLRASLSPS